jgi:hypothetical protein
MVFLNLRKDKGSLSPGVDREAEGVRARWWARA